MAAKQVDHHDARLGQASVAASIEAAAVMHGAGRLLVVQVHLDDAEALPVGRITDKVGRIALHQHQPVVFRGQAEPLARHPRQLLADLHHRGGRVRAMAMGELGERGCPQPQLQHLGRRLQEQQPGHHVLDVGQHQLIRMLDVHGALHPGRAEVQVADAVQLGEADDGLGNPLRLAALARTAGAGPGTVGLLSGHAHEGGCSGLQGEPDLSFVAKHIDQTSERISQEEAADAPGLGDGAMLDRQA